MYILFNFKRVQIAHEANIFLCWEAQYIYKLALFWRRRGSSLFLKNQFSLVLFHHNKEHPIQLDAEFAHGQATCPLAT